MRAAARPVPLIAAGLLVAGLGTASLSGVLLPAQAQAPGGEATVTSVQVPTFLGARVGDSVQGLIWRGGLELQSQSDTFGGLSGISFTGPEGRLVMVSDRGNFVSGQLVYDELGQPLSLVGVRVDPMQNSRGSELPRAFARDAEAMDVIVRDGVPVAVRVGFENLTRVADFSLVDAIPSGAAREINIPQWLSDTRTNASLESVCIAPPASPIAGSTLLITEGVFEADGTNRAWLLGRADQGPLTYRAENGTNPTDCVFLPNGDLLVLERGIAILSFSIRLKRVAAADVRPGATMEGEVLLNVSGSDIDNLEGIAVHEGPGGETRITMVSDNNFNDFQRSLLLEFSLPQ